MPYDFISLTKAAASLPVVRDYIHNGTMVSVLSSISDVEIEAAKDALKNKDFASQPIPHVREAAIHLRSAHFACIELINKENEISRMTMAAQLTAAARKDVWILCNLMLCHVYLEERKIAKRYVTALKHAYKRALEKPSLRTVGKDMLDAFGEALNEDKGKGPAERVFKGVFGFGLGVPVFLAQDVISNVISVVTSPFVEDTPEPPDYDEFYEFIKTIGA